MKKSIIYLLAIFCFIGNYQKGYATEKVNQQYPIGKPGSRLTYVSEVKQLPASVIRKFELSLGAIDEKNGSMCQWLRLDAVKENGQSYSVHFLTTEYPSKNLKIAKRNMLRYILQKGDDNSFEFVDAYDGSVILPNTGAWRHLLPRAENSTNPFDSKVNTINLLGLEYKLESVKDTKLPAIPMDTHVIRLTPNLLIGVPHNAKVKNETRRYDESDYEYVAFTKENYFEMIANGMNIFNVNAEQLKWIENRDVYYWGIGGANVSYPECLYTSNYIGPAIFFDEPMVHTRDHVFRPKFKEDPSLRKRITPKMFFEEFKHEYHKAKYERSPIRLLKELNEREDVSVGTMDFLQQNIYTWETMPSSALYQLSEGDTSTPAAMVFEPPGRLGARRVLPELNMSFDCQIPVDDPNNLFGIIKGFIRGAARQTNKDWGISIYGQVVRSDAYWQLTHAYDQGATRFFYWDSYQLAAVPYNEYLSMSKNLREYAKNFPNRNLEALKNAAEVAILIPPGYNLGHVKMGIGNFSGLPELNMERLNGHGIKYRDIMNNFYIEIERCIRLGVEYDLFWNLENFEWKGYREVIDIREDGKVEVSSNGKSNLLNSARIPQRPEGNHPLLEIELENSKENENYSITAIAKVTETTAPVFYTQGAGKDGIYRNTYVLWELYGPEEEDYTDFWKERWNVVVREKDKSAIVKIKFKIDKPGNYRLRVSTTDVAGRSTVVWKDIKLGE
jgi:hypothetical protein